MMKIFAIAVLVVSASALPSSEEPSAPSSSLAPADLARAQITELLQAGKDDGACADLAAATIKEVEDSVDNQQKILNALDTGADCPKEGQAAVDSANAALQDAQKAKQDADAAFAAAKTAMVKLGPKSLSSLNPGDCGFVFNDPAYKTAKSNADAAETAAVAAGGAVVSAQQGVEDAKQAQIELIAACQCKVKKAYEAAWEAANKNNEADTQAYTKGKHMQCVLSGTSPAACQVGAVPTVAAITLAEGVMQATCTEAPTPVPTPVPTPDPTPAPAPPQGDWTNANQCNKDSKGCCKGWPNHDNRFSHTNRKESQELNMADCMAKGIKEGGHTMIAFAGAVNGDGNKHRCDWWPSAPVGAFNEAVSKGTCCHYWTICPINQ